MWVKGRTVTSASDAVAAILFIHGGCANLQQWREQEPALKSFCTVLYDAYGCGKSDKPQRFYAYAPENLYRDAEAVLQNIDLGKRGKVIVIGHSFGAALALRLASEHQEAVGGLLLISPYAPAKDPVRPSLFSLAACLFYLPDWVLAWVQPSLTEGFLKAAFHKQTWQSKPGLVEQERKNCNANPPYMFKAFHRQLAGWANYEEYCRWAAEAPQPTAVIYGDADQITPLLPSSKLLMQNLKQAHLTVVEDASHQVMQEKPEAVNAAILELVRKVTEG